QMIGASTPLRLTDDPASESFPAFSPDGQYIAFVRYTPPDVTIRIMSSLGGTQRVLTRTSNIQSEGLDWSPDSRSIAFADTVDLAAPSEIYILSHEAGRRKKVTSPPLGYIGDRQPRFSPDGQSIAFVRTSSDDISWICLSDMHGGEPRRITENQHGTVRG